MKKTILAGGDSVWLELALLAGHSFACNCETPIKVKTDNIVTNLPGMRRLSASSLNLPVVNNFTLGPLPR